MNQATLSMCNITNMGHLENLITVINKNQYSEAPIGIRVLRKYIVN